MKTQKGFSFLLVCVLLLGAVAVAGCGSHPNGIGSPDDMASTEGSAAQSDVEESMPLPDIQYGWSWNNWMSGLADNLPLTAINIPGTHDTCTATIRSSAKAPWAWTQNLGLRDQLNQGIRFIDIRAAIRDGSSLGIYHGNFDTTITFSQVLYDCREFLRQNPTECIVMSVKAEHPNDDANKFSALVQEAINCYGDLVLTSNAIPTLESARGHIVLVSRFGGAASNYGINMAEWHDNEDYFEQYIYGTDCEFRVEDKYNTTLSYKEQVIDDNIDYVRAQAGRAKDGKLWCITFTSLNGAVTPNDNAKTLNPWFLDRLEHKYGAFLGTVVMDYSGRYGGPEIIKRIVERNF